MASHIRTAMLTFQILDGGETFYWQPAGRRAFIGSDESADIRLTEPGVAPRHARIEPIGDSTYKLVDETDDGVLVNGERVAQVRLHLGDRVEIGRAVLVLGRRVARRATPTDVLRDSISTSPRSRRSRAQPTPMSKAGWATAAVGLVVAGGIALWASFDNTPPPEFVEQARLRKVGQFDRARQILTRMRSDWAGSQEERLEIVRQADREITNTAKAAELLGERISEEAAARTFADQITELKHMASLGGTNGEAARIVHGRLDQLRRQSIDHRPIAETAKREVEPAEESAAHPPPSELHAAAVRRPEHEKAPTPPNAIAEPVNIEPIASVSPAQIEQQAREARADHDYARAETLLSQAANAAREAEPQLAQRLDQEANAMQHLNALASTITDSIADGNLNVRLRTDADAVIHTAEGGRFRAEVDGELRSISLADISPRSLRDVTRERAAPPTSLLGAAALAYSSDEPAIAEYMLARAVQADGALEPEVWDIIRQHRTEPPDPSGYQLVSGKFVGRSTIKTEELVTDTRRNLESLLRTDVTRAERLVKELITAGGAEREVLEAALSEQQTALASKLNSHPFKRRVHQKLATLRTQLDTEREHARKLIFDEITYFYPFEEPQVDAGTAMTYARVQKDVDSRVSAVRRTWMAKPDGWPIPNDLRGTLAQYRWVAEQLDTLGLLAPGSQSKVEWALSLPDSDRLSIQSFCRNRRELETHSTSNRIEAMNEERFIELSPAERELVTLTNDYRRMLGETPLALNMKILEAAREHCVEMSTLVYFGHFSPTPGKRTPEDRMKLAGYVWGEAENCAKSDTSTGAHSAWTKSSGHHRNLLRSSLNEFGVGNTGLYWTQNFGGGNEFLLNELDYGERKGR